MPKHEDQLKFLLISMAEDLKPYITQNCYPDDYIEVDAEETARGLQNAQRIFDFIKQRIPSR